MSQRPPASRPASSDGQRITLPPVQLRDDLRPEGQGRPPGRPQQQQQQQQADPEGRGYPPSVQQSPHQHQQQQQHARASQPSPAGEDWRSSGPSRDLGVHSILNPTEPDSGSSLRRQSGNPAESPSNSGPPRFGASPSTASPRNTFSREQPPASTPPTNEGYSSSFPRPRRILTPRSPSRSISTGRGMAQPTATIDTHQSPFLPSRNRSYMAEPGPSASSEIPPMPTPPGNSQQQHYGFPSAASTPSTGPQRASGGMQAPGRAPLSQSASPSISASSHGPPSNQTSPASFLYHREGQGPPPTSSSYFPGSSFGTSMQQGSGGLQFQAPGAPEGPYSVPASQTGSSSAGSSRQTSASDPIQVMTITTLQGSYTVPVDVHQASRLADEKRRRNAGASSRFRQRRKTKEIEAQRAIEKLQQQTRELERKVRDLEHERDFYRTERDRLRDVMYRTPDMRHLAMQGPPSPQAMRTGSYQGSMTSQLGPPPPPPMGFQPPDSGLERAPRRRRTDTQGEFTGLPYSLPPASTLPPVQAPSYTPGPPSLPPLRIDNPNGPQQPPSSLPPSTTAGPQPPYEPYARGPYERGWPGESGRR